MKYGSTDKILFVVLALAFCGARVRAQVQDPCPRPTSPVESPKSSRRPDKNKKDPVVIYYDARQDKFCYGDNCQAAPLPLETGEHAILEVCHARFGEQFDFTMTEKTFPEAGAPVRGLDDVAGLIKGLPGTPGAKGAALLESARFTPFPDVNTVVGRLRSLQDVIDLKTELQLDLESIQYGSHTLDEEQKKYRRAICQMTALVPEADCIDRELGLYFQQVTRIPPLVDDAEIKIKKLQGELNTAQSFAPLASGVDVSCPSNFDPKKGQAKYTDRNQFVCFVRTTNLLIGHFKNLRAMIQQPPLGGGAADLISALEEYKLRIFTFQKKLKQVRAAIEVENILLNNDPNLLLSRLKKIQDSYKDVITSDDIQKIADDQKTFLKNQERGKIQAELSGLEKAGGELGKKESILQDLKCDTQRQAYTIRAIDLSFGARVYHVNQTLVKEIKELYHLYDESEVAPLFVQMFTWGGNTGVILNVKASDSFKPLDLSKLELPAETLGVEAGGATPASPFTPAAAPAAVNLQSQSTPPAASPAPTGGGSAPAPGGGGNAGQAPGGNASTVTTTDLPVTASTSTAFEVHKTYRFNVAAGVLFSSLRQDSYALRTPTTGGSTSNPQLVLTGRDHLRLDFPIFLTTYIPSPLDVFANGSANKWKFGTAVGFSTLDVTNNGYAGAFLQPKLGLDFIFGLHLGRRKVPDRGITLNTPILDPSITTPPVHQEWKPGFFFTVGFDALTFKKLLFGAN